MDKRYKPMTAIEQLRKRQEILETINQNPDWPFYKVARYIRTELHLTLNEMAKITIIATKKKKKMEQPNSNPTLESMMKLLSTFGLKIVIRY